MKEVLIFFSICLISVTVHENGATKLGHKSVKHRTLFNERWRRDNLVRQEKGKRLKLNSSDKKEDASYMKRQFVPEMPAFFNFPHPHIHRIIVHHHPAHSTCEPIPCQNGGTCQFEDGKVVCKCKGKFSGPTCADCSCPKGNAFAVPPIYAQECDLEGSCYCADKLSLTENGCTGGQKNVPCESNPCQNGGTCVNLDNKIYQCNCAEGFTGTNCEKQVCTPGYCLNGGICKPVGNQPTCICQPGYTGARCENKPETKDYCHPNPCLNSGTCVQVLGGYDCHCDEQYTGAHCEVDKCAKCDVHAICVRGRCKCIPGYIGTGYECIKARKKHCPMVCPIYSTCIHGACQCLPGYQMQGNNCIPPLLIAHKPLPTQPHTPPPTPPPPPPPPPSPPPIPLPPLPPSSATSGYPAVVYYYPYGKRSHVQSQFKSS